MDRLRAHILLGECTGVDIWPVDMCRDKGIPEQWIEELSDCFESGFNSDFDTIYVESSETGGMQPTNQFYGVQDLQLARKIGHYLGVDTDAVTALVIGRRAEVQAIQEAVEES